MQNVHIYDGKIKSQFESLRPYTKEECVSIITKFLITSRFSSLGKKVVGIILREQGNTHAIHNLDALVILTDILIRHEKNDDCMKLLDEQLKDMQSGLCPSGRCTRLYQVWIAFT